MVKTSQRNYGIDLLRIVSMMMVCTLHVLLLGGAMPPSGIGEILSNMLLSLSYGAVNCYALISGYVGVNSKVRYRNIIRLWLQVVFYCVGFTLVFHFCGIKQAGFTQVKAALSPVLSYQYWYFSAYFFLFFFTPYLNRMINALTQKELSQIMIAIVFFFSILQTFTYEVFSTHNGYSIWWILPLYILGGSIRKSAIVERSSKYIWLGIYVGSIIVTYAFKQKMLSYISPSVLFGCIALLIFCSKLQFGVYQKKLIAILAPLTFGVYLIHLHPLMYECVMPNLFASLSFLRTRYFVIALPLCVLGLYSICSFIDGIRSFLFKKLGINILCEKIEKLLLFMEDNVYGRLRVTE